MRTTDTRLEALVALKRQRAEQRVLSLRRDLERLERDITALRSQLAALDTSDGMFEARQFVAIHGFVEQAVLRSQECNAFRLDKLAALEAARQALRVAIFSEEQVGTSQGQRRR